MLDCEGSLIAVELIRSLSEMEPSGVSVDSGGYNIVYKMICTITSAAAEVNMRAHAAERM